MNKQLRSAARTTKITIVGTAKRLLMYAFLAGCFAVASVYAVIIVVAQIVK